MKLADLEWIRQPQEQQGDYMFNGHFLTTAGVKELLNEDEIYWIYVEIQVMVKVCDGLDYLQVLIREADGQKLFFIDQLTRQQVDSGEYQMKDNYCTLMLAEEY